MTLAEWTCVCPNCKNVFTHEIEVSDNFAHTFDIKPDNIHLMASCPACGEYIELNYNPIIRIFMD